MHESLSLDTNTMKQFKDNNEEELTSSQWHGMELSLSLTTPSTDSRRSMEELQEILLDSIARNNVSPVILNELEMLEERQIWRVTDTASEQRYTKACLLRFLGLLCHKFGVPLVRDRLIQTLHSSLMNISSNNNNNNQNTIMEIFIVKSTIQTLQLQTMEDVLQIDRCFQKSSTSTQQQQQRKRIYGLQTHALKQPHNIDRSWIPPFVACVTELVIHMQQQNNTPTIEWESVALIVKDIVANSIANIGPGWIEAGIVLAAMTWMEQPDEKITGLTSLTILPMLKDPLWVSKG